MRIAIVDDERPAREELRYEIERQYPEADITMATSGTEILEILAEQAFDLLFLDVNLGDIKGIQLAPAIRKLHPEMLICLVTAYSEYAVKAFELGIDDYIVKPFQGERLARILERASAANASDSGASGVSGTPSAAAEEDILPHRIPIHQKDRTIYEKPENIVFIETYDRGCRIYTTDDSYYDSHSIGSFEKMLPSFFRIHKSYLVNPEKIRELFLMRKNSFCLRVEGYEDQILPIARDKLKALRELLEQ